MRHQVVVMEGAEVITETETPHPPHIIRDGAYRVMKIKYDDDTNGTVYLGQSATVYVDEVPE